MSLLISKGIRLLNSYIPIDWEAADYARRVEAADGQALEPAVFNAYNAFVLGCKADSIWNAIKASCILAGARTLQGALVPLVGTAPTNFNFVSGDYNRKTGLLGDGSTKYLDSNRAGNADPQNNYHLSIYRSAVQGNAQAQAEIGYGDTGAGSSSIFRAYATPNYIGTFARCRNSSADAINATPSTIGLHGISRSQESSFNGRAGGTAVSLSRNSQAPAASATLVFTRSQSANDSPAGAYSASRISFYSIGESLDLALLDARVTELMNALGAAIP